jgi:hypothetical protein
MQQFTLDSVFHTDLATFERAMDDTSLDDFVAERLKSVKSRTTIERREEGPLLIRRIKCMPAAEIPSGARKFIPEGATYWVENIRWDRANRRLEFSISNDFFKNRFVSRGRYSWEERKGAVHRHIEFELTINFRVALVNVGPLVEKFLVSRVKASLEEEVGILRQFLTTKYGVANP